MRQGIEADMKWKLLLNGKQVLNIGSFLLKNAGVTFYKQNNKLLYKLNVLYFCVMCERGGGGYKTITNCFTLRNGCIKLFFHQHWCSFVCFVL